MEIDYGYLAESLASLSGLPVRLYKNEQFLDLHHQNKFSPDLAMLEEANIFKNPGNVSYYMTDTFLFYGLFRLANTSYSFVIGPATQIPLDMATVNSILRSIGEPASRTKELLEYMHSIPPYPLSNFLQILCTMNYFINGEKINVTDLLGKEMQEKIISIEPSKKKDFSFEMSTHNTYDLEQGLLSIVEHGQVEELNKLFTIPSAGRAGMMANESLRQQKNEFICTVTLVTRAAIRGGLERETAFSLSDVYIQKVELLNVISDVVRMQESMIIDFTKRVDDVSCGEKKDPRIKKIRAYIYQHINERITNEELSKQIGLNRTYLCKLFEEETGKSTSNYVMAIKMDEAKRLLSISGKPIAEIADYLGFSSQSHFQNTFKKICGLTPKEYRKASQ
jgi:YSIRK-targeted surface antigen transcriptional regulator